MWSRSLFLVIVFPVLVLWTESAQAEGELPLVVLLEPEPHCGAQEHFLQELSVQIGELPVEVQLLKSSSPEKVNRYFAKIWLCVRGGIVQFFVSTRGEVYRQSLSYSLDEKDLSALQVGLVGRSAVEVLLQGGTIETEVNFVPKEVRPIERANEDVNDDLPLPYLVYELGLGYVGTSYGDTLSWQSGLGLHVAMVKDHLVLGLGYDIFSAIEVASEGVEATLSRHPILVRGAASWRSGSFEVRGGGVISMDVLVRKTHGVSEGYLSSANKTRFGLSLGPELWVNWKLSSIFQLEASGGLEIYINRFTYVTGSKPSIVVLEPRVLRPRIHAGIAFIIDK